jgi:competence protein ComEA
VSLTSGATPSVSSPDDPVELEPQSVSTPELNHSQGTEISTEQTPPSLQAFLGLTRADQWFLGLVCSVGLVALIVFTARLQGWGVPPIEFVSSPAAAQYRVEINRATWIEWAQLEGLGEKLAKEIVAEREVKGPFTSIDDLIRVKGIGPANLERFRPWLIIESPVAAIPSDKGGDK